MNRAPTNNALTSSQIDIIHHKYAVCKIICSSTWAAHNVPLVTYQYFRLSNRIANH